jgi:predicted HicB family RNase H-like nuclease
VAVRKIIVLVALVAFAAGLMFICGDMALAAKDKPVAAKDKPAAAATTETKKVEEKKVEEAKVACKFKTKDDMQEFEQLYVAKQATFGRMSVLQAYFSLEQNNLQEIDKQMEKKFNFKMDPNKMYDLNRDAMEIREAGPIPQPPAQQ